MRRIKHPRVDMRHQHGRFDVMTTHPLALKLKRIFFWMIGLVVIAALASGFFLMYANYSEGYRVGNILKLSKKGVILKTWEGELSQGFLEAAQDSTAGGVATRIWYFTVKADDAVIEQINHAIDTNKKVKAFYKEKYTKLPWVGDTLYIVYKVEEVL